jgi:hypothetical protein
MMAYGGRNDGLFRGAILQSGGAFPLTSPDTAGFQGTFDSLISKTNCSSLENASAREKLTCIRKLSVSEFISKVGSSTGQAVDGDFSRTSIQRALPAGKYIKVPTIVGSKYIARNKELQGLIVFSKYGRRHSVSADGNHHYRPTV